MTWYRLACIDLTQPDATTPALIWLEDVSSVGPECKAPTYQTKPAPAPRAGSIEGPTWVTEKICIVSLRNGQTFFVRAGEAALLKETLQRPPTRCAELNEHCHGPVNYWCGTFFCEFHTSFAERNKEHR